MTANDDWYRSGDWTPAAQEEFERRLGRARTHRPHYLRVKGLALEATGRVEEARGLWRRVLDDPEVSRFHKVGTTEDLADSLRSDSPARAASLYRQLTELAPNLSGTSGTHQIKLAQLLLDSGSSGDLQEVEELLDAWITTARNPFPSVHFSWNLTRIRWAQAVGDKDAARASAERALDLAGMGPVFSRHPTVGLVGADEAQLRWLRYLAAGRHRAAAWARRRLRATATKSK